MAGTKKVEDIIGKEALKKIVTAAAGSQIKRQQMTDVAWALSKFKESNRDREVPTANEIGGRHERRMNEKDTSPDKTEMTKILVDWNDFGDMPQDRAGALEVLINVFEENGNKPLARDLRTIKEVQLSTPIPKLNPDL